MWSPPSIALPQGAAMVDTKPAVVSVADCLVSDNAAISLITYAPGSCIAVAIHDPVARVGGLLHLMLPESSLSREKAEQNPFMFADSGVPLLFRRAYQAGAEKRRLIVWLAGGAQVMDDNGVFNIGKRNYLIVRKLLWHAGVLVHAEDVGGGDSRTVRLDVGAGRVHVRTSGGQERPLEPRSGAASVSATPRPSPLGSRALEGRSHAVLGLNRR
jgi:chemotaxis protein CheD